MLVAYLTSQTLTAYDDARVGRAAMPDETDNEKAITRDNRVAQDT